MSESRFGFKYDEFGNTREILVYESGVSVNSCSIINKGTAFNSSERDQLGLQACLPPGVRQLEDQILNSTKTVDNKIDDIEKFIFIRSLFDRNVTLAHALIGSDIEKYLNLIYAPTIGEAVKKYSSMFRQANGLHFYPGNIDKAEDILRRYLHRDIRVAVVTDNQGVLGLGDQGAGGIAICLGKLMIYTQGAGIAPWHCLPISLDVGTDNEELLNDDQYLGWRHSRLKGEEYLSFVGRFTRAFRNVFPNAVCQWEDFSGQNAFSINDSFTEEIISFNDDIQGSGTVVLAGLINGMKKKKEKLEDQKILICGTGAVGIGIAETIELYLESSGCDISTIKEKIYTMDESGVTFSNHELEHYKSKFAKDSKQNNDLVECRDIVGIINRTQATVLIVTDTWEDILNQQVGNALLNNSNEPIIFALAGSVNDLSKEQKKSILITTGMQTKPEHTNDKDRLIRKCHNGLVFPGVGLGVLASGARVVLPQFFLAAAKALANEVNDAELTQGALVPNVTKLQTISVKVALAVAMKAVEYKVSRPCVFSSFQHMNDEARMKELINKMRWQPDYLPLVAM